jgi:hypothetical protein
VPILRDSIQNALLTSLDLMKLSANNGNGATGILSSRDGGLLDNLRFLLAQGKELGDSEKRRAIIGNAPVSKSESAAEAASISIMRTLRKTMDMKGNNNDYVDFTVAIEDLLGLSIQGLLIEVLDRPSTGRVALAGAVLVGETGDTTMCSETALEIIRKTQRREIESTFLKCHTDEVVGLHMASRYLASRSSAVISSSYRSQYQRLLKSASIPIVFSNEIIETLGIDVVMKKYKYTTQLVQSIDRTFVVNKNINPDIPTDIQIYGPFGKKKVETRSENEDTRTQKFWKGDNIEAKYRGGR